MEDFLKITLPLLIVTILTLFLISPKHSRSPANFDSDGPSSTGVCETFTIAISSENRPEDIESVKSIEFCKPPSSVEAERLTNRIKQALREGARAMVSVECDGINGSNKFQLVRERLDGYRKICSISTDSCRNTFKYESDSEWHREEELFSRMCHHNIK